MLEIASDTDHEDMIASIVCNVPPRVGECIDLLGCDRRGEYWVTGVTHVLDDRRRAETVQHVCVYVPKK